MTTALSGNAPGLPGQNLNTSLFGNQQADQATGGANPTAEQAATKTADPVDTVDLSDEAKLRWEKLKDEKATADQLVIALAKQREDESETTTKPLSRVEYADDIGAFDALATINDIAADGFKDFDKMLEASRNHQSSTNSFSSREEMFESLATASLVMKTRSLEIAGKTEQAQQLRDAAVGGTLKFEDPSKVDGLNLTYERIVTESSGGGRGVHHELNQNPVGDVKDALDSGRAFTMGQGDFGAFYVTVGQADATA